MLTIDDRVEINETLALYAHIVDSNQLDRLDELFTPDAVYDMGPVGLGAFEGIEVIRVAAARMAEAGQAPLAHYVTNVVMRSTEDGTAVAQSKGLLIMANGKTQGVTHDDILVRYNGDWRISRRLITPVRPATAGSSDH